MIELPLTACMETKERNSRDVRETSLEKRHLTVGVDGGLTSRPGGVALQSVASRVRSCCSARRRVVTGPSGRPGMELTTSSVRVVTTSVSGIRRLPRNASPSTYVSSLVVVTADSGGFRLCTSRKRHGDQGGHRYHHHQSHDRTSAYSIKIITIMDNNTSQRSSNPLSARRSQTFILSF